MKSKDVIIIGAGAAGLMAAITAAQRGRSVLILEGSNKPGKKILMSGGGRCNFTNTEVSPNNYISHNPHFCKSALSRYTPEDFIALVEQYNILYHEKEAGQLFCNNKSKDILNMLLAECDKYGVEIKVSVKVESIRQLGERQFSIGCTGQHYRCESVVIATGGLSIPTLGASPFGYKIAEQFGIKVWPTRAGLVPLTLDPQDKNTFSSLPGVSVNSRVTYEDITFSGGFLFTHRGISGPPILQISSYWQPGTRIEINLLPTVNLRQWLIEAQKGQPKKLLKTVLSTQLPKSLVSVFLPEALAERPLQALSEQDFSQITSLFSQWKIKPNGTEGYRTAEVTLGGVDCDAISSKTMETNTVPGLFFVGEVLDVTGWLGGYNFQWAWASGWAAGQVA